MEVRIALLLLFSCFDSLLVTARIAHPCDVAEAMLQLGLKKATTANWVCLAKYLSGFNMIAVSGPYPDGSYDFGIFQINDKYCRLGTKNSCGVSCTDLVSTDLLPSAKCALNIFKKEGFVHWKKWKDDCEKINTSRFIRKCKLKKLFSGIKKHQASLQKGTIGVTPNTLLYDQNAI